MITLNRLNGLQRDLIFEHLASLSNEDVALRFGHYMNHDNFRDYVNKINFNRDIVLGAFTIDDQLVGFCHSVGYHEKGFPVADVGISVNSTLRGQGIAWRLLQATFDLAAQRQITKIYIYTLRRNTPMYKLMKKLNGQLIIEDDEITVSFDLNQLHESEKMEHFIDDNGIEHIRKIVNTDKNAINILFVHGAGGDAWQWRSLFMPYFAKKNINTLAISLPNHGQSKKDLSYNLEDYVTIIKNAHETLGTNTIIVGHSMGGFLVQKYSSQYPINNKIILLAAMPPFNPANLDGGFISLIQHHLKDDQARQHLNGLLGEAESIDTENILSPIVLLAGLKDSVIPLKWTKKMSFHYKAPLYTVDSGHNLMLGKNWEEVAQLLEANI